MSAKTKKCLECHTVAPAEALTCLSCGGGSWPLKSSASRSPDSAPTVVDVSARLSEPPPASDEELPDTQPEDDGVSTSAKPSKSKGGSK